MRIDPRLRPADLAPAIDRLWRASARKVLALERRYDPAGGAPVFTSGGRYTSRGWTDWTQGFQYGSALLQFDATGDRRFLEIGRRGTIERMAPHLTHTGVHDHGFNNVSTYGALWRLAREGRLAASPWETRYYELALKCSGAVQAARWTALGGDTGFIYSFNGPHSLFVDTIRSLRSLAIAHRLGHVCSRKATAGSAAWPLVAHARAGSHLVVRRQPRRTASGARDPRGIFHDRRVPLPQAQQGYRRSRWTRGQAWASAASPTAQFMATVPDAELRSLGGRRAIEQMMITAARAAADHYIAHSALDGVPYWDVGAPGLPALGDITASPADPWNGVEPVDSSAAAIAAQGMLRLGHYLQARGRVGGQRYWHAGLTVTRTLLGDTYLSSSRKHEGLLLHAVYHRPNGWDIVPAGQSIPCGESCMWGDYHLRELALYLQRVNRRQPCLVLGTA
jgi:hypothetical protein